MFERFADEASRASFAAVVEAVVPASVSAVYAAVRDAGYYMGSFGGRERFESALRQAGFRLVRKHPRWVIVTRGT